MKKAKIKIKGIKPLIWHAFNKEALSLDAKPTAGKSGNNPEEWKATVLVDPDNKLYVKDSYIFASFREGSKNVKVGRGTLKAKLISCLIVLDTIVYIKNRALPAENDLTEDVTKPVYLDICGVTNPNTKGKNIRYRIAASKGWESEFTVQWDDRLISTEQMKQIAESAGLHSGIGDGRNWGNGRFDIVKFDLVK